MLIKIDVNRKGERKMKKVILIILIVAVIIIGGVEIGVTVQKAKKEGATSSGEEIIKNGAEAEAYIFSDNGKEIALGEIFSKESLGIGNEESYSEIASCAFEGLDKTYTYANYEITTYPDGDKDRIYTIYFLNTEAKTAEGVSVSDSLEKMIQVYGDNYEIQGNQYTYTKGKTQLQFIVENDVITSIQYSYVTE